MRLIRSIETYKNYINNEDIVELVWAEAEAQASGNANIASLMKSASYKNIAQFTRLYRVELIVMPSFKVIAGFELRDVLLFQATQWSAWDSVRLASRGH